MSEPTTTTSTAWDAELLKNPHAVADKRRRVQKMFSAIAPSYDLNNRLHSLWMDQRWRKKAAELASVQPQDILVDVACGTGDLTSEMHRQKRQPNVDSITRAITIGIDFTFQMLPIAVSKSGGNIANPARTAEKFDIIEIEEGVEARRSAERALKMFAQIQYLQGDAQSLPLEDQSSDVLSIAFGIRNVADPAAAIREFFRVLRPAGRLIILEFSLPTNAILRGLYNFYFRQILPRTATLISGDKTGAYKYLPESVNTFIGREQMVGMMREAGFENVEQFPMTFGVCVCYRGVKQ